MGTICSSFVAAAWEVTARGSLPQESLLSVVTKAIKVSEVRRIGIRPTQWSYLQIYESADLYWLWISIDLARLVLPFI